MREIKFEPKTLILKYLRDELEIEVHQKDVGTYFGLTGADRRNSIGRWERNVARPKSSRRTKFISYLWDKLQLRHNPILFMQIWLEVMVEIWGWDPLDEESVPEDFPRSLLKADDHPLVSFINNAYYTGRRKYGIEILEYIKPNGGNKVCVIHGMAGIGKTMLASQVRQAAKPFYPDDPHWIDVGSLDAYTILTNIANSFNIDVSEVADLDDLRHFVWKILVQENALLILDDVQRPDQINSVLPVNTGKTSILMTTQRVDFPYLVKDECKWIELKPFPKADAIRYFGKVLKEERVQKEFEEFGEISELLEYLPLALAIAAGWMKPGPYLSAKKYLEFLSAERSKLDHLEYGDRSVRASFNVGFNLLSDDLKVFFIALGAFGGIDFDEDAAAYLGGCNEIQAFFNLANLRDRSLCIATSDDRYRLHSLLRDYAREKIKDDRSYLKMSEYYKDKLKEADTLYNKGGEELSKGIELFEKEWSNIQFGQRWASENQQKHIAAAEFLSEYAIFGHNLLEMRFHSNVQLEWHKAALKAAQTYQNEKNEGIHLFSIGVAHDNAGAYKQAIEKYQKAIDIFEEIDDKNLLLKALNNLGLIYSQTNMFDSAIGIFEKHLPLAKMVENKLEESNALGNLGLIYKKKGDLENALKYQTEALNLSREINDQKGICSSLIDLTNIYLEMEKYDQAEIVCQEAVDHCRGIGNTRNVGIALNNMATVQRKLGRPKDALPLLNQSMDIEKEIGSKWGEGYLLVDIATTYHELGDFEKGIDHCQMVFELTEKIDDDEILGDAHFVFAKCSSDLGELSKALDHLLQAEKIYNQINYDNSQTRKMRKEILLLKEKLVNNHSN